MNDWIYLKININDIIYDAMAMQKNQFKVNNVVIEKNLSSIPITIGDSNQLQTVFLNLINNAYDAMYEANKKGKLVIKTYMEGNDIIIEFLDDGPGVPETYKNKLFDPFFTTKDAGKGLGLGLTISYNIVDAYGGKLSIKSKEGKGTTVYISLPKGI